MFLSEVNFPLSLCIQITQSNVCKIVDAATRYTRIYGNKTREYIMVVMCIMDNGYTGLTGGSYGQMNESVLRGYCTFIHNFTLWRRLQFFCGQKDIVNHFS